MLKLTVLGEKLMKASTGGETCCWGGSGDGCDCTPSNGANFSSSSEKWLKRMEQDMAIAIT